MFHNIIVNAIDAMKDGGNLSISTSVNNYGDGNGQKSGEEDEEALDSVDEPIRG